MSILAARLVQITDAQLNLATGICVESADGHIMTGNKILLEDVVLAREHVAVLQISQCDLIEPKAR
ncbi:hypothetical protein D3C84_1103110 [compost metagenome]